MFTPYTTESLSAAYQLRWLLAIFPNAPLSQPLDWTDQLSSNCEPDGIRVLEAFITERGALSLLLSTQPHVKPQLIVQRVKGRLQHLLRSKGGPSWRRNFRLTSIGDASASVVDQYLANQLGHHTMATPAAQQNLAALQWHDESLDINRPIECAHGQYAIGLHVVLVNAERWCNADSHFVELTRNTIRGVLAESNCPAARIAPLADHVHASLRLHYSVSPAELIVKLMNEVCHAHDGSRMLMEGYYAGTVGAYDMATIRKIRNRREA